MADEQIRIDITAEDDASKVLDDVADQAEKLEKLEPEVVVSADTDKAEAGIKDVVDAAQTLSRQDTEIILRARIDDAKGALKALRDDLDQTGEKAQQTARELDKVGGDGGGGLQTRGNAIADLTGPLGEASGAASDFAGVFDGLGDIASDVAGKLGASTKLAGQVAGAMGGLGIAVAAGAAAWSLYKGKQEEAKKKQDELIASTRELNKLLAEGKGADAAQNLVESYSDAFDAAKKLGVTVGDLTRYITGQSDILPTTINQLDMLKERYADTENTGAKARAELLQMILAFDDQIATLESARDAYVKANGSIEEQDAVLRNVAMALGLSTDATKENTRETNTNTTASERAERQAKRTADAFDEISTALDMQSEAEQFRTKMDDTLFWVRSGATLTKEHILDIKQGILDVATYAGLTPIEVRSMLDRIDNGDVDRVVQEVNHRLQDQTAKAQVELRPPTPADYRAMNAELARGMGIVYFTAALNQMRSGAYGPYMARVNDAARPTVTLAQHDRAPWWNGHGQLVVALERLPQAAYVWDDDDPDVVWDDTTPERVWDAPFVGSGFTDVFCDLVSLELVTGEPDSNLAFRTPYARLQLRDPGDGRYRSRTVDGRLVYWAPGRRMQVWWRDETGVDWWLFAGRVATWKDSLLTPDVTVEAYASLGGLATPLGRQWTAGTTNDFPSQRIPAILAVAPAYTGTVRADLGDNRLTVPPVSDTPKLDELRRVARSDGGVIFADVDDTIVYRDRRWRAGRSDQTTVPIFSAVVCELGPGGVVAWDVTSADIDERLAGRVTLTNVAGLTATATNVGIDPSILYTHPDTDLWSTQAEGNTLAAWLAANRADARLAIGNMDVHLHDIRFDYWHQVLDRRIGDRVRFLHEDQWAPPGEPLALYDLTMVLSTIRHQITAESWTVQLATSPAVTYTSVELWDWTTLVWDDPSTLAVWR